jgi:hypothetical protein
MEGRKHYISTSGEIQEIWYLNRWKDRWKEGRKEGRKH